MQRLNNLLICKEMKESGKLFFSKGIMTYLLTKEYSTEN